MNNYTLAVSSTPGTFGLIHEECQHSVEESVNLALIPPDMPIRHDELDLPAFKN